MSDPIRPGDIYFAPGASGADRVQLPGASQSEFPPVDERLVEPETDREMIGGQVVKVAPSEPPHADRQVDIGYVLRANAAPDYVVSAELLTRVSGDSDFATDVCIRKKGVDARGHRYLEELSFEVKYTQSQASLDRRARYLIRRGVRRVFAVHVRVDRSGSSERVIAGPVVEWSVSGECWTGLAADDKLQDRCLRQPIEIRALLDAVEADNAVARALVAKGNAILLKLKTDGYQEGQSDGYQKGRSDGYQKGQSDGLRQAVRDLCEALAIELTPERLASIDSADVEDLDALRRHLLQHRRWVDESSPPTG